MKKLFIYAFFLAFTLLPFKAFAAVNITLNDSSTTTQKSVDITVNTGTDTTQKIAFQIQASDDVTITSLSDTGTVCGTFTYTNSSNLLTVTCTAPTAKVLDGTVATILFESSSTDYGFMISRETGLDLGTLTLGTVTDITNAEPVPTTESTTVTTPTATETKTEKSFQDMLTDYLPYILIGGATILLISILGILLSKKKDGKSEEVVTQVEEKKEEAPAQPESRPTDIDNISGNLYTPQIKEESIQEKLDEQPVVEQPIAEAPATTTESNDLADLMAKESTPVAMPEQTASPSVDFNTMPVETPTPNFNTMPTETATPVAEQTAPAMPSNLPDMQQMVNNTTTPDVETTPTEEPQSVPPVPTF